MTSAGARSARTAPGKDFYERIEKAVARAAREAGLSHSGRLGKLARAAVDAADELDPATIERAIKRPARLKRAFKAMTREVASPAAGAPRAIILGDEGAIKPLAPAEAESRLAALTQDVDESDPYYATWSTTEAAKALKVSRPTVLQWIKTGRLIGLAGAKRGWRVPKAQIRRAKPAPGLKAVIDIFGDPETAWHFLVQEQSVDGKSIRPLDRLFAGEADFVAALAAGYGRDFL